MKFEGETFFDNLNGQSEPFLLSSCQAIVSVIYIFPFVPDSLLIEHLKLSCHTHSFSLNLNFDFLESITL